MSFWEELVKTGQPIVGLSPMDGVTDAAMRYMVGKYGSTHSRSEGGGLDVMFTEFVSVDALHYATGERRERLLKTFVRAREVEELQSSDHSPKIAQGSELGKQWPYEIAQVFGKTPEYFAEAAELIEKLGFDGIDINMGCPAHKVEENGAGAGLIRTPKLAREIVRVVKSATKLPVSVKTRIGVDHDESEEWMESLMEVQPAMISLHGRTLKQLYQGMADWDSISRAARIVHKRGGYILGNGDIESVESGMSKVVKYGVDGFLIGRAAEGNPGIFVEAPGSELRESPGSELGARKFTTMGAGSEPWKQRQLAWMVEHARIFEQIFVDSKSRSKAFLPMRKHLAWYCKGFPGASELRAKLVQANSVREVEEILVESGSSW